MAKDQGRRGEKFKTELLKDRFPDMLAPFQEIQKHEPYPVVFRLPLRQQRSQLGEAGSVDAVREDMRVVSQEADSMLLFAKSIRQLAFHEAGPQIREAEYLMTRHSVSFPKLREDQRYGDFMGSLPRSLEERTCLSQDRQLVVVKRIESQHAKSKPKTRDWVVAYTLANSSDKLKELSASIFQAVHGAAVLPLAAAAATVSLKSDRRGQVCCGLPTPVETGATSWIHSNFMLASSRRLVFHYTRCHATTTYKTVERAPKTKPKVGCLFRTPG